MAGKNYANMNLPVVTTDGVAEIAVREYYAVKISCVPIQQIRGVDTILGPGCARPGKSWGIPKILASLCQSATRAGRQRLPRQRLHFSERQRPRQTALRSAREGTARAGIPPYRDTRTRCALEAAGVPADRLQSE